ncbi:MAG: hypothetical protein ABW199_05095 [Caulobacterales bacterium]
MATPTTLKAWYNDYFKRPAHSLGPRLPLTARLDCLGDWRLSVTHSPAPTPPLAKHIRAQALAAIAVAFDIAEELEPRTKGPLSDARFYLPFPGEHYALLAAVCRVFKPMRIIEVGTFTGMSARIFADYAPPDARIETYDIVPWHQLESHLRPDDFSSGRVVQHVADILDEGLFSAHRKSFEEADLIFLDAPKNGVFEQAIVPRFMSLNYKPNTIMLLDDIRLDAMINVWADIKKPKLELTGFGHWSGTGFVQLGAD